MFCIFCGTKLPAQARFCKNCGKPQDDVDEGSVVQTVDKPANIFTSVQSNNPEKLAYDVCEIIIEEGLFGLQYLIAQAVGPKGVYIAAKSGGSDNYRKPGLGDNRELDKLIKQLTADGWEFIGKKGSTWYSVQFKRRSDYEELKIEAEVEREIALAVERGEVNLTAQEKVYYELVALLDQAKENCTKYGFDLPSYKVCQITRQLGENGNYLIAVTLGKPLWQTVISSEEYKGIDLSKPTMTSKSILTGFVRKLKAQGWLQLESQGSDWYQLRLFLPLENSESSTSLEPVKTVSLPMASSEDQLDVCEIVVIENNGMRYFSAMVRTSEGRVEITNREFTSRPEKEGWMNRQSIERLVKKLQKHGWQQLETKGPAWYSYRFKGGTIPPKATLMVEEPELELEIYVEISKLIFNQLLVRAAYNGKIPGNATSIEEVEYDVCEITAKIGGGRSYFVANSYGKYGLLELSREKSSNTPEKQSDLNENSLAKLVNNIEKAGWIPLEPKGKCWFSHRFYKINPLPQQQMVAQESRWPEPVINYSSTADNAGSIGDSQENNLICEIVVKDLKKGKYYVVQPLNSGKLQELEKYGPIASPEKEGWLNKSSINILAGKMKKAGWEQLEQKGAHWYSLQFKKPHVF